MGVVCPPTGAGRGGMVGGRGAAEPQVAGSGERSGTQEWLRLPRPRLCLSLYFGAQKDRQVASHRARGMKGPRSCRSAARPRGVWVFSETSLMLCFLLNWSSWAGDWNV